MLPFKYMIFTLYICQDKTIDTVAKQNQNMYNFVKLTFTNKARIGSAKICNQISTNAKVKSEKLERCQKGFQVNMAQPSAIY